jgi:HAE1 family hydrophobic/amphiphilic exporter-1/multidrug efflux pump
MLLSTEKKAESLEFQLLIAQTQLSLSGQRFGYFMQNGKQYIRLLGNLIKRPRNHWFNLMSRIVWDNSFKWIT